MKLVLTSLLSLLLLCCAGPKSSTGELTITGILTPTGITSYQYGTHKIEAKQVTYALRSNTVNLNEFVNKTVTITGKKIDGYPIDNGPVFLEVSTIVAN